MTCHSNKFGNGARGFVCTGRRSRRKCVECGKPAEGKDLCPKHAAEWAVYPKAGAR